MMTTHIAWTAARLALLLQPVPPHPTGADCGSRAAVRMCSSAAADGGDRMNVEGSGVSAIATIRELVAERGRCSLAEIGDHLRATGVGLPAGKRLSDLVSEHADEFRLSGSRNNRKLSRLADTTEMALLETVRATLQAHGPMTSAELRLRLREQRSTIPGLLSLLRQHADEFHVHDGGVRLVGQVRPPISFVP